MKFKVESSACQGAAVCLAFLTEGGKAIYELNDESKAEILTKKGKVIDRWVDPIDLDINEKENLKKLEKTILDSARSCPFLAIFVQDEKGRQLWPES